VKEFLRYVNPTTLEDDPVPSYASSLFSAVKPDEGLLLGGNIKGLESTSFNGQSVLKYGGRIVTPSLWLNPSDLPRIPHDNGCLLTHRDLELAPTFGITTKASLGLNPTHTVFGEVLEGDEFVRKTEVRRDKNGYSTLTTSILASCVSLSGTSVTTLYPNPHSMQY